jgi:hypothetical protein
MTVVEDSTVRERIVSDVQAALDRYQPRRYRVSVNKDAILQDEDWYHVVVVSPNDVRDRDFYDALAQAEADLQDVSGRKYLLVPAIEN